MEPEEGPSITSILGVEDDGDESSYGSYSESQGTSVNTLFSSRRSSLKPSHDEKLQVATLCYVYSKDDLQASASSELDMLQQPSEILAVSRKIRLQSISSPSIELEGNIEKPPLPSSDSKHKQQLGWSPTLSHSKAQLQLLSISEEEVAGDNKRKLQSEWSPTDTEEKVSSGESKREPSQSRTGKESKSGFPIPAVHNDAKWYRKSHMRAQSLYHRAMLLKTKLRTSSYDLTRSNKDHEQQLSLGTPFSIGSMITDRSVTFPIPSTTDVLEVPREVYPDSSDAEALPIQKQRSSSPQAHGEHLQTPEDEFEEEENEEISLEAYLTIAHKRLSSRESKTSKSPVSRTSQAPYSPGALDGYRSAEDTDYMSTNFRGSTSPHLIDEILGPVESVASSLEIHQEGSATSESSIQTITNLSQSPSTIPTPEFYKERPSISTTLGTDSRMLNDDRISKLLSGHVTRTTIASDNRPPSIVHTQDETVRPFPPHAVLKSITDDTREHLSPISTYIHEPIMLSTDDGTEFSSEHRRPSSIDPYEQQPDHPHENLSIDIAYQQYYRSQTAHFLKSSMSTQGLSRRETVRPSTVRRLDIQAAKLSLDRAAKLSDVIDTKERLQRSRLKQKYPLTRPSIADSRSTDPLEQSYNGVLDSQGGARKDEVYDFRSDKDIKKLKMIKIQAKKWMARAKQHEQVEIIAAQQGRRALVETPRALKQVIWKEAYSSVNKAYELYKSSLGAADVLTQGALNHLIKFNEYI